MNQRAIIVAVVLFVLIVCGMFAYAYVQNRASQNVAVVPEAPTEEEGGLVTQIDAKHFFSDGTHTLAGEVLMPTPCDLLDANAIVRESDPEQVTLALNIINNSEDVCAQVVTPQRFKVSFEASEGAVMDATFQGKEVRLNLREAGPNENPDDFELFIKG